MKVQIFNEKRVFLADMKKNDLDKKIKEHEENRIRYNLCCIDAFGDDTWTSVESENKNDFIEECNEYIEKNSYHLSYFYVTETHIDKKVYDFKYFLDVNKYNL